MNNKAFSKVNNSNTFEAMGAAQKDIIVSWIQENLEPHRTKHFYQHHSSYSLKHSFEDNEQGFYITNGQFKGAMLESGFEPKDVNDMNWIFQLGIGARQ